MIRPIHNQVVVQLDESIATAGEMGIYVPPVTEKWRARDGAVETENRGTVVRIGTGKVTKKGKVIPMQVKVGDVVRFSELEYSTHKEDGNTYVIISEDDIAFIEEAE